MRSATSYNAESEQDGLESIHGAIRKVWSRILDGWINWADGDEILEESRFYQRRRCRINKDLEYCILRFKDGTLGDPTQSKNTALKAYRDNYRRQRHEVTVTKTFVFYCASSAFREGTH